MLHLRSDNGIANVFAIDVFSSLYASTISSASTISPTTQFTRTSNALKSSETSWYIKLRYQLTGKEYFCYLGQDSFGISNFRAKIFFLYIDDSNEQYHLNLTDKGLYNYEIYHGEIGISSFSEEGRITNFVHSGMAMVHDDNFVNDYFQNSTNGVEKMTIPNAISYNG